MDALQPIYLAKALIRRLATRKYKKSAIVITSSGARQMIMTGLQLYSATKNCVSFLAEAMHQEVSERIDVLAYEAGGIDTKLVRDMDKNAGGIRADVAAKSCFYDLGGSCAIT